MESKVFYSLRLDKTRFSYGIMETSFIPLKGRWMLSHRVLAPSPLPPLLPPPVSPSERLLQPLGPWKCPWLNATSGDSLLFPFCKPFHDILNLLLLLLLSLGLLLIMCRHRLWRLVRISARIIVVSSSSSKHCCVFVISSSLCFVVSHQSCRSSFVAVIVFVKNDVLEYVGTRVLGGKSPRLIFS